MRKLFKKNKLMAAGLVLSMAFTMTGVTFAADPGYVDVSITYGNFSLEGEYTGGGFTNAILPVEGYPIEISNLQNWVDMDQLKPIYLPAGVADPLLGEASVLDAIILACIENGYDLDAGWDSYSTPNGGYISNIAKYQLITNAPTYYQGANGNMWGNATGTGWNIAYTHDNGMMKEAEIYASNIEITDGMDIIIDVSPYDMHWDTGVAWTE